MDFSQIKEKIEQEIKSQLKKDVFLSINLDKNFGDLSVYLPEASEVELNFDFIERKEIINNFLNIFIKKSILIQAVFADIEKKGKKNKKIVIEYLCPNTNKPLHLGHLRNGLVGLSMANLFSQSGYQVEKINLINDRGIHICKSMLAYQKWGENKTPQESQTKPDHFVGYWYMLYSQKETPELKKEAQVMLKKWEQGDKKVLALWKKMNNWVYQGHKETWQNLNFSFNKLYYESQTYQLGKKIVGKGLQKNIFYYGPEGEILFDLPAQEFGLNKDGSKKRITLLRKDKTSVYLTQDLGSAVLKQKKHKFDQLIYVVGLEQTYHFKSLFYILKKLGYKWADNCFHFAYGTVDLPEGKMSSRKGTVINIDDLLKETQKLVLKKHNLQDQEKAFQIALAAINFNFLLIQPKQGICFDVKKSISLEGKTGPYCQYSLVRALSILKKAKIKKNPDFSLLKQEKEIVLIRQLSLYQETIKKSVATYNPSLMVNYIYNLAKSFNQFYHQHPVLGEDEKITQARLALVQSFIKVMKQGLSQLNIPLMEKM